MSDYTPGRFVWFELSCAHAEDAVAFYTETLGWKTQVMPMGESEYTMFAAGDQPHSGLPPRRPGDARPSHWVSYVSVEDVDDRAAAVKANGGQVVAGPMDIPTVGRFATVTDPEGAVFNLFHAAERDPADGPSSEGGFHWNELWAKDASAVLPFYQAVLGYEVEAMEMPTGAYHVLKKDGVARGGVMTSPDANVPAMWLPYVHVADSDATIERAKAHGADIQAPAMDVPGVGRFGIFLDPTGAAIGVITPDS